MINVAIVGATGYTGMELIKILSKHSKVRLTALTTRQEKEIPVFSLIPSLSLKQPLFIKNYSYEEVSKKADVVFLCLPHTETVEAAYFFRKAGKIVIDLSADFRLKEALSYEKAYGVKHNRPEMLQQSVYGLSEFYRSKIKKSDFISNPGCYPTSILLPLIPLLEADVISLDGIVADSKSGVSGAGKKLSEATHFCQANENFLAYKVGRHQHQPEIEQGLSLAAGKSVKLTFVPHLLPLTRGILSTIYCHRKKGVASEKITQVLEKAYAKEFFVRFRGENNFPSLSDVQHTNFCDVGVFSSRESSQVIVVSAIDNLVKGASGQAVQNMNIRCGFSENEGF